jgi:site-specific DNA recombinase
MKCVVYARVSSKEQEKEGFSIPAQQKLLREYAGRMHFEILAKFTDVETAKAAGRIQFGKMVSYLREHPDIKAILVEKTDRLYRNFRDYVLLEDLDVEIHLVKENETISKNSRSHAKFIHGIKVLMAKNFIDNLSEEVKKGMREKAEQGDWPNKAPLGYLNNKETRQLEVDSDRAQIVAELFELYATGEFSITALHQTAKELGLKYRTSNRHCSRSNIERILKNPIYAGAFIWNGQLFLGNHQPIISQGLYDRVQTQFRKIGKSKCNSKQFAFKGILTCGICGCVMTAEIKKGRYVYYRCTNGKGKCSQTYVREERLAKLFAEVVKRIRIAPDVAEEIRLALKESLNSEKDYRIREVARLKREYARLQTRLDQCYLDKIEGRIDTDFWKKQYDRWTSEQNATNARIQTFEQASRNYYEDGVAFLELAQGAYPLYVSQSPAEQGKLLRKLLSNCQIEGLTLYPTYKSPFNLIVEVASTDLWLGDRDSNPDTTVQSRMSYRWTIPQSSRLTIGISADTVHTGTGRNISIAMSLSS